MIGKILVLTTAAGAASAPRSFFAAAFHVFFAEQSLLGNILGYFIFIMVFFLSFILPLIFIVPTILNWRKNRYVLRHGEPARAKILKIWDTGVTVNDNPQVGLLLAVYPENLDPYQAETKKVISRLHIPQIQTGEMLEVKYNPRKPSEVALVL